MSDATSLETLQQLDLDIMRARKRLDELPEKRAILETRQKMKEVAALAERAGLLVHKLELDLKVKQDEIASLTERIDSEQSKVMETSDHRQAQSISREMDGFRRRRDKVEMESLQEMERIDSAKGKVSQVEDAAAKFADREKALIARYKEVGGVLQGEIAALEKRRAETAATVSETLLKRYEAIAADKGGIGLGKLEGDTCTACRVTLPAARVDALKHSDELGVCPNCRRLIIVVGEES